MDRMEFISRNDSVEVRDVSDGVQLRVLTSGELGSRELTTCLVVFQPSSSLAYHNHPCGEAITVLEGSADVKIEGRRYRLGRFDSVYVPSGVAHAMENPGDTPNLIHTAFPTSTVEREFLKDHFETVDCDVADPSSPESLRRFADAAPSEVAISVEARDLFAKRFGSRGICGGYGLFQPGSSLFCHTHDYDESITIVTGEAVCQVAGKQYIMSAGDNACVPNGHPHRFLNLADGPMEMMWVYAGDEPDRIVVDHVLCQPIVE